MSKIIAALILSFGSITMAYGCELELFGICIIPGGGGGGGKPVQAPEIDPASAISGVMLLVGGLAVLRGRGKTKQ